MLRGNKKQKMVGSVVGNGSSIGGKVSHKCNNDTESDNNIGNIGKASTIGPGAWSQNWGHKYAFGLCCRPSRATRGVVRCGDGH